MKRIVFGLIFLVGLSGVVGGCEAATQLVLNGANALLSRPNTPVISSLNYDGLVKALKANSLIVEGGEEILQPFFSVDGKTILANGESIQVFEYADTPTMESEAGQVAANGASVGTTMVNWIGAPHFFKQGRLIVIYIGDNKSILSVLQQTMGSQFAGG